MIECCIGFVLGCMSWLFESVDCYCCEEERVVKKKEEGWSYMLPTDGRVRFGKLPLAGPFDTSYLPSHRWANSFARSMDRLLVLVSCLFLRAALNFK